MMKYLRGKHFGSDFDVIEVVGDFVGGLTEEDIITPVFEVLKYY